MTDTSVHDASILIAPPFNQNGQPRDGPASLSSLPAAVRAVMLHNEGNPRYWQRLSRLFAVAIMPDGEQSQSTFSGPAAAVVPPEVLLVCPECAATFRPLAFETHLRQVHRIFQFRGVRRSFNDTFAVLLDALTANRADAAAWQTLSAIAIENHGPRATTSF